MQLCLLTRKRTGPPGAWRAPTTGPRWLGAAGASCSRPVHMGLVQSGQRRLAGDGGAAAGGPGERRGGEGGYKGRGGGGGMRPSQSRSQRALERRAGPGTRRTKSPVLSCPAASFPGAPWVHPVPPESRVGGSVFCPLVGAWRCAAVSRSGLTPLPLFPQGCSSHLQHLEAVSLSSQWANPPKARRQCPLAQPRSARLPPRALGLPEGSSGLGVAVEGGLLCRIGSRGGCMGKDPMARNTPPCPAGPRGPEPRPSLLGRERPCWGGADQRPERGGCSGVTLPQGGRALGSRSCGPESPSQQRPGAVGLGGGEEPAKGRPAWGGHQHVSRRKGGMTGPGAWRVHSCGRAGRNTAGVVGEPASLGPPPRVLPPGGGGKAG